MQRVCNWCEYRFDDNGSWVQAHQKCPSCYRPLHFGPKQEEATTQKAKGVLALRDRLKFDIGEILPVLALLKVSQPLEEANLKGLEGRSWGSLFARPCPPNPEHGFVESRILTDYESLETLRLETLAVCAESEIMVTPLVKATWNALWTPSLLSLGKGHDGATAGKNVMSFPLSGVNPLEANLINASGMKPDASPYIEAVGEEEVRHTNHSDKRSWLTQLRGGPFLASGVGKDFVPVDMVVEQVIQTNGEDLLEWAKVIRALKGKSGTIVWHPGGGLTDHYSVHCRENNVPIAISFQPVPGLVLEAAEFIQIPPLDPTAMLHGLAAADRLKMGAEGMAGHYVALSLLALHNSAVLRGEHSYWIGVAVGVLLKLGSAAMRVEARHAHSLPKGVSTKNDGYEFYGKKSLTFHRAGLSRVTQILHYGFGDPDQSKSFGGLKWALCGAALVPLFNGVRNLARNPSEGTASELLLSLNLAINQAHNGGWWLNKFILQTAYDKIPLGDVAWTLHAAPAIFEVGSAKEASLAKLGSFIEQVSQWPETEIEPLRWRKAALDIGPGSFVLNLKAATLPIPRTITIPTTPALLKSLIEHLGEVVIERGRIKLRTKTEEILLWQEAPLAAKLRDPKNRATW